MISDKSQGGRHALLYVIYVSFSVATLTTIGSVSVRALWHVCCSVRVCTDLFSWWPDGVLGRDLCHLITWGVESGGSRAHPVTHSQSAAAKNDPIEVLRPSTHHRWRSSNARRGRTPASAPRTAGHPLFGSRKFKEMWVLVFDRSKTGFLYQTFQNQACFFVIFGFFFGFCLFRSFFAPLRVTVEFFVVFPNKSHAWLSIFRT